MSTDSSWTKPSTMAIMVIFACMLIVGFAGCGPRAPQITFANRHYSAALRTATNTRNQARLSNAKKIIARDHASGKIHAEEYEFYCAIITLAEAGHWKEAEQRSIQFRRDQLH